MHWMLSFCASVRIAGVKPEGFEWPNACVRDGLAVSTRLVCNGSWTEAHRNSLPQADVGQIF